MNELTTAKIWKNKQHWQFPDTHDRVLWLHFSKEHSIQKIQDLWLTLSEASSTPRTSVSDPEVCSPWAWLPSSPGITYSLDRKDPVEYCTQSQQIQSRKNGATQFYSLVWAADFFLGKKAEERQWSHPFDHTSQTPAVFPKHPEQTNI